MAGSIFSLLGLNQSANVGSFDYDPPISASLGRLFGGGTQQTTLNLDLSGLTIPALCDSGDRRCNADLAASINSLQNGTPSLPIRGFSLSEKQIIFDQAQNKTLATIAQGQAYAPMRCDVNVASGDLVLRNNTPVVENLRGSIRCQSK